MYSLTIDFDYQIVRTRRKSVAIVVRNGLVEVRAPKTTPKYWIKAFVEEKHSWITKQLEKQAEQYKEIFQIKNDSQILYLGKPTSIKVSHIQNGHGKNNIHLLESMIHIQVTDMNPENIIKQFDKWLLKQAKIHIPRLCQKIAEELNLKNDLKGVKFRKTKTKWGHCTADGVLQFNQLIMLAPEFVIDYLIVHELCHLKYLDHSSSFWKLVAQYRSDYQLAEEWLKLNGHKLWYR